MKPPATLATVCILTFNGARYAHELLTAVTSQELDGEFDVLVIDSGSTDGTLDIVASFPEVRLHQIPNVEFGHGKTRNLGAQLSRGEFTAYLTHDAVPASGTWLAEILRPMRDDSRVGAVLGRQIPRPGCQPIMKYEIHGVFAGQGPAFGTTTYAAQQSDADGVLRHKGFYSDVNSAARTAILTGAIPYRDVKYAEDQLFGRDLLIAGWHKAYAGAAAVIHSNDLTYREYRMRIYDETLGLRRIGFESQALGLGATAARAARASVADALRIATDPELGRRAKLTWLVINPWYQFSKWAAIRRASREDLSAASSRPGKSLEDQRRATLESPRVPPHE